MESFDDRMRRNLADIFSPGGAQPRPIGRDQHIHPFTITATDTKGSLQIDISWVNDRIPRHFRDSSIQQTVEPLLAGIFASAIHSACERIQSELVTASQVQAMIAETLVGSFDHMTKTIPAFATFLEESQGVINTFPDAKPTLYCYSWADTFKMLDGE